jgi:hypothetical protein
VAVLDAANQKIAIFVDPSANSFYGADGSNNADAAAAWAPAAGLAFQSYSLVENEVDQATFSAVLFSASDSKGLVPIPATIGAANSNTATIAVDLPPAPAPACPN